MTAQARIGEGAPPPLRRGEPGHAPGWWGRRRTRQALMVFCFLLPSLAIFLLYRVIPLFYEGVEAALAETFADDARRVRVPVLVRFGSWIGGDLVGHPDVTGKSIRATLARHRSLVLDLYYNETHELARRLSQMESRIGVSQEVRERVKFYSEHFPKAAHAVPARHRRLWR